jgi:lipopolysaccharide export system protein LptA
MPVLMYRPSLYIATGRMIKPFIFTDMKPSWIIQRILFSVMLLLPFAGLSQATASGGDTDTTREKFIIIDHFGKLVEDMEGVEPVKWISNGLQLRIDSTNIYADSAVIFGEDRLYAYGNVVIQEGDSLNVFTDSLYYFKETDIAQLRGEVTLDQVSRQLWTNNLDYHLGDGYAEYLNGGVLVDDSLQVSSKRGFYYTRTELISFRDSVIVLHPRFNLAADSMKYSGVDARVIFTGPTNIYTPEAEIYCESGYYDLVNETAEFSHHAQYAGAAKKATADTIRYNAQAGEILMLGNVKVEEQEKRISGTKLRYLENSGETWIYGEPAHYTDSTRVVNSPQIFYNEKTNIVSTLGGGRIQDGDMILEADYTDFDKATGVGRAYGDAFWSDVKQGVGVRADTINSSKETEYVLAYNGSAGRPYLFILIDGDTLYIAADTLTMYNEVDTAAEFPDTNRIIRAYHDVRLYKSDMQGKADSLVFNDRDSLFNFFGAPVLWTDTTQFSADSISMFIRNRTIDKIRLTEKAIIITQLYETFYDQIKGKRIIAQFDSSEIKEMWVTGNAESIYYTRDDDDAFIGVNQTICSRMYFTFTENQIDIIKYFGENSSAMTPMSQAPHSTMRLEGFKLRFMDRPNNVADLLK